MKLQQSENVNLVQPSDKRRLQANKDKWCVWVSICVQHRGFRNRWMIYPVTIMEFCVIRSDGEVIPHSSSNIALNSTHLQVWIMRWVERSVAERSYVLQQDSAPYYTNSRTQSWQSENIYGYLTLCMCVRVFAYVCVCVLYCIVLKTHNSD